MSWKDVCLVGCCGGFMFGLAGVVGGLADGRPGEMAAGALLLSVGVAFLTALVYLDAEVTAV